MTTQIGMINKQMKTAYALLLVSFIILSMAFLTVFWLYLNLLEFHQTFAESNSSLEIYTPGLDEQEVERARSVIDGINPLYLTKIKKVTFVKGELETSGDSLWGYYRSTGEIFIKYRDNVEGMKITMSHETMHSFLRLSDEDSHRVVFDLGRKLVIYDKD